MSGPTRMESPDQMFDEMRKQDSDTMDFVIERKAEPGKTFSADALSAANEAMTLFMGARIARRFEERAVTEPGVSRMRITMRVELDGESREVAPDQYPWYIIDGAARAGGMKH